MTREEIEEVQKAIDKPDYLSVEIRDGKEQPLVVFRKDIARNILVHIDRLEAELAEVKAENEEMESFLEAIHMKEAADERE